MLKIQKKEEGLASSFDKDYQVGVFAYTENGKVVLVTSRGGESWIGGKMPRKGLIAQVKREALGEDRAR